MEPPCDSEDLLDVTYGGPRRLDSWFFDHPKFLVEPSQMPRIVLYSLHREPVFSGSEDVSCNSSSNNGLFMERKRPLG